MIRLFPFQTAFLWLLNGGDPKHLLIGTIFQAWKTFWVTMDGSSFESPNKKSPRAAAWRNTPHVVARTPKPGGGKIGFSPIFFERNHVFLKWRARKTTKSPVPLAMTVVFRRGRFLPRKKTANVWSSQGVFSWGFLSEPWPVHPGYLLFGIRLPSFIGKVKC